MVSLSELFQQTSSLHHAYVIEGDSKETLPALVSSLEKKCSVISQGNPDFWVKEFDSFGVDDARTLREMQMRKSATGENKFFIISLTTITEEAQNALLKAFEEPTEGTHFFIIASSLSQFFPTLLSRVIPVSRSQDSIEVLGEDIVNQAKKFLTASSAERLSLIAGLLEAKDKYQIQVFLNALEKSMVDNFKSKEKNVEFASRCKKITEARRNLSIGSPSAKLVFEHLALTL